MNTKETYTIDAAGRTVGRVASEAAKALMGKMTASYTPHILSEVKVVISNASKLRMTEKKKVQTSFQRYSGYPGGQKIETVQRMIQRKGFGSIVRHAIERMLPNNTMRVPRLKNLTITE